MARAAHTSCKKARAQLALAASQDLSEAAARSVWAHLASCMECRREYSSYLEVRSALTALTPTAGLERDPEEFFDGLHDDILDSVRGLEPAPRGRRGWWAGTALAAALFVAGIAWMSHLGSPPAGLLEREPIEAMSPRPSELIPLLNPQGLEAQRQVDLLFDPERDTPTSFAGYGGGRRSPGGR